MLSPKSPESSTTQRRPLTQHASSAWLACLFYKTFHMLFRGRYHRSWLKYVTSFTLMVIYKFNLYHQKDLLNLLFHSFRKLRAGIHGQLWRSNIDSITRQRGCCWTGWRGKLFFYNKLFYIHGVPLVDLCKRCGRPPQIMPSATPKWPNRASFNLVREAQTSQRGGTSA